MVEFERGYPRTPGVYLIKDYNGDEYGVYGLTYSDDPYVEHMLITDNGGCTWIFDVNECEYLLIEE